MLPNKTNAVWASPVLLCLLAITFMSFFTRSVFLSLEARAARVGPTLERLMISIKGAAKWGGTWKVKCLVYCAQLLTCNRLFSSPEVWVMKWVWPENPRLPPTDICVSMLIVKSILQFCFENYKVDSDFSLACLLLAAQETEIFPLPAGCRFSHSQLRWRCLVGKSFSHPKQQPAANLASELHLEDASPHRGGLWRWELRLPRIYGSIQQKLM